MALKPVSIDLTGFSMLEESLSFSNIVVKEKVSEGILFPAKTFTKVTSPLGSNARACRFESCHPHQKASRPHCGREAFSRGTDSKSFPCKCPVDTCCHQFKNWWLPIFFFPAEGKKNAYRVLSSVFYPNITSSSIITAKPRTMPMVAR